MEETDDDQRVRIDKWLWAARFFKTRSLAADAVSGGKIKLNGERPKPAKWVTPGDQLQVRVGPYEYDIEVRALSRRRGPAPAAQKLFAESEDSRRRRELIAQQLKARPHLAPQQKGRPTKRDRRKLARALGTIE